MPTHPRTLGASVAAEEIDRFSQHAGDWWNPDGVFRPLHRINPVRLEYVRDRACAHFRRDPQSRHSLKNLKILDVGCGGGLMTEPLARLGGAVSGIDASEEAILTAKHHAMASGLKIDYRSGSAEELAKKKHAFDFIIALEVVEHVANVESFLATLATLLRPRGLLILSTLNRTPKSFLLGIVAAEYILGWIPRGTHEWNKFIRPSKLVKHLEENGLRATDLSGLIFNPLRGEFELHKNDLEVNYFVTAGKP